jgi:hypothetical protein
VGSSTTGDVWIIGNKHVPWSELLTREAMENGLNNTIKRTQMNGDSCSIRHRDYFTSVIKDGRRAIIPLFDIDGESGMNKGSPDFFGR